MAVGRTATEVAPLPFAVEPIGSFEVVVDPAEKGIDCRTTAD